jgi:hypothetical protein
MAISGRERPSIRHALSLPRRESRPGFASVLPPEGVGAPKSAVLWFPRPLLDTAGASRRASRGVHSVPGRAFQLGHRARARPETERGRRRAEVGRRPVAQYPSRQPAPGRVSYWTRAEPRHRPGAIMRRSPAGAAPRPANRNASRQRPSEGRGDAECKGGLEGGDKRGTLASAKRQNPMSTARSWRSRPHALTLGIEAFKISGQCRREMHALDNVLELDLQQDRLFGLCSQHVGALLQVGHLVRMLPRKILRFRHVLRQVVEFNRLRQLRAPDKLPVATRIAARKGSIL